MDHDANVIGAALLAGADRLRTAMEAAAGRAGGGAAALTALHAWADGEPIEALAGGLGLSHSRAVRVIDRLAADGLVRRVADPGDRRRALVRLTPDGRRTAEAVLRAREAALEELLGPLDDGARAGLAGVAATLVGEAVDGRRSARLVCRFCDTVACGHAAGGCPATRRADALEAG